MQITIKFLAWANKPDFVGDISNLQGADLQSADLHGADLRGADLHGADLRGADLQGANLRGADLQGADLQRADLQGADLQDADLRGANLRCVNLLDADLQRADLQRADLQGANLRCVNLLDADLKRADLQRADLQGAKNIPPLAAAQTSIIPEVGQLEGFKKLANGNIAHLLIPAKAQRSNANGRKCRASEAKVLAIWNAKGIRIKSGVSKHDSTFKYTVGKTVKPDSFDADRWNECSTGIHFFITRIEAENY